MFFRYNNTSDVFRDARAHLPALQPPISRFWSSAACLFLAPFNFAVDALISPLYKQWFVILTTSTPLMFQPFLENTFTSFLFAFFSYDSRWFRYINSEPRWAFEIKLGLALPFKQFLNETLRVRRNFLLQFGQRRVCTRTSVWFMRGFFGLFKFDKDAAMPRNPFALYFTYKHLYRSNKYSAGMLLNQPNLLLFTHFLSNPYFWQVLQQTLHSQYRY